MNGGVVAIKPSSVGSDGVSVDVEIDGIPQTFCFLERNRHVYLPELAALEKQVLISVHVLPDCNIFGFSVDGKKNIIPKKNHSTQRAKGVKVYRKIIPIHRKNEIFTLYNENNLRLLEIGTGGYFAVYETAIVFQKDLGFLTTQRVYEDFVFKSGKELFCPEVDGKWPQLITFMKSIYMQSGIDDLPCFSGYNPFVKKADNINLDDGVGIVKWFNVARGFGVISTNKGDTFFHYKDVDSSRLLVCPTAGEEVLFEELVSNDNDKSSIPWKANYVIAA